MTLPAKRAETGPTLALTLAVNSVSETLSTLSQPGMHCFQGLGVVEPLPYQLTRGGNTALALHFHLVVSLRGDFLRGDCRPSVG